MRYIPPQEQVVEHLPLSEVSLKIIKGSPYEHAYIAAFLNGLTAIAGTKLKYEL